MLKTKSLFKRRNCYFEPDECVVEKVITLSGEQYDHFAAHLHHKHDFIRDNIGLMYFDSASRVQHCLLVIGEGREDGILVQSEGAEYAQNAAFMPHAASIISAKKGGKALAELNNKLIGIVDYIVDKTLCCPHNERCAVVDIDDLESESGLILEFNNIIIDTIYDMLYERAEVQDVEIDKKQFLVTPDPTYITQRESGGPTEQEQDEVPAQTMGV